MRGQKPELREPVIYMRTYIFGTDQGDFSVESGESENDMRFVVGTLDEAIHAIHAIEEGDMSFEAKAQPVQVVKVDVKPVKTIQDCSAKVDSVDPYQNTGPKYLYEVMKDFKGYPTPFKLLW